MLWPAELLVDGLKLAATASTPTPAAVTKAGFTLDALLEFRWQLTLAGEVLTDDEVTAVAEAKRPLVRLRGRWVTADPALIARLRERRSRRMSAIEALAATLTGSLEVDGQRVAFAPSTDLAALAGQLTGAPAAELPAPAGLEATLRAYQHRGFCWLVEMAASGLGGCLADDMGLGKTVAGHRVAPAPPDRRGRADVGGVPEQACWATGNGSSPGSHPTCRCAASTAASGTWRRWPQTRSYW